MGSIGIDGQDLEIALGACWVFQTQHQVVGAHEHVSAAHDGLHAQVVDRPDATDLQRRRSDHDVVERQGLDVGGPVGLANLIHHDHGERS